MSSEIILASASSRRKNLLERIGLEFSVHPSGLNEDKITAEKPEDLTIKLARQKAEAVAGEYNRGIFIGADTIVVNNGEILGKPASPAEAEKMLEFLRGSSHSVITGVCIIRKNVAGNDLREDYDITEVEMRDYRQEELEGYVSSQEPLGKAGAYAIQGLGGLLVRKIEGSYFNVVGLPLHLLGELLYEFGVDILGNRAF